MIQLPKINRDPNELGKLCLCRPICKSRRREWEGVLQNTSAELAVERKMLAECFRRWPMKVYPNSPCPLFARSRRVTIKERGAYQPQDVVRICAAPVDDVIDTTYLKYAELAKRLGAWQAVRACCAFCKCGQCCCCSRPEYVPRDAERAACRRDDMRHFDARVKHNYMDKKIMYN